MILNMIWSLILQLQHCVKSVRLRRFSWSVFSRIRTEYGPEKTPYLDTFHAVQDLLYTKKFERKKWIFLTFLIHLTINSQLYLGQLLQGLIFRNAILVAFCVSICLRMKSLLNIFSLKNKDLFSCIVSEFIFVSRYIRGFARNCLSGNSQNLQQKFSHKFTPWEFLMMFQKKAWCSVW